MSDRWADTRPPSWSDPRADKDHPPDRPLIPDFFKAFSPHALGQLKLWLEDDPVCCGNGDCPDWQDPDYSTGADPNYIGNSPDALPFQYALDCSGQLIFRGGMSYASSADGSAGDTRGAFLLPAAYRPSDNLHFLAPFQSHRNNNDWMNSRVQAFADGSVYVTWPAKQVAFCNSYTIYTDATTLTTGNGQFQFWFPSTYYNWYWSARFHIGVGTSGTTSFMLRGGSAGVTDFFSTTADIGYLSRYVSKSPATAYAKVTTDMYTYPSYVDIDAVAVSVESLGLELSFWKFD